MRQYQGRYEMKESEFYCGYFTADRTDQHGFATLHEAEQKARALAAECVDPAIAVWDRSGKPCVLIWGSQEIRRVCDAP
ncbi:hypothetical protein KYE_01623 [Marinobacter manganoxydans MnI7-9]|uniref:Uncharacterized protein n=1 Tax=Marinobacter manganoxydans MnI7-9 TaxID=1094979 RepID=G6YNB0_9GAMM|nr:hypothetical protein KYE_01623 [Marinobacter manganoxydans MnI7-9]